MTATRETLAVHFGTLGTWISVHTGVGPGTTGANEATGGGYARRQTTWAPGTSDGIVTGSEVTFSLPAGTYTWIAVWSAATGGTLLATAELSPNAPLAATGELLVTPRFQIT